MIVFLSAFLLASTALTNDMVKIVYTRTTAEMRGQSNHKLKRRCFAGATCRRMTSQPEPESRFTLTRASVALLIRNLARVHDALVMLQTEPPSRVASPALATSPTAPVAPYPPLPALGEQSRAPEFYGFVAWTSTSLLFGLYLLWGLLPPAALENLGITWYPNRYVHQTLHTSRIMKLFTREWSVLLPAYSVMLVLLTYAGYFALALSNTPSLNELRTVTG